MRNRTISLTAAVIMVLALVTVSSACTSIMVPASSSASGSTSVTHTCDAGGAPWELYKVDAKTYPAGTMYDLPLMLQMLTNVQFSDPKSGQGKPTGHLIPQVEDQRLY